ncbi:MAG: hypothetical protein EXR12_16415 [Rhodospirillaceae bacterium]|nr:hypothetical protein [Rhodospirillaceae bacterium]
MSLEARIAEVHAADVANARVLLKQAIEAAREQWIPANAIVDVLIQELIDLGSRGVPPARTSAYLRGVAHLLDRTTAARKAN